MGKVTFTIGDVNDELSVAYAKVQGYNIALQGADGDALITPPDEDPVYHVFRFRCDCPDATIADGTFDGHCRHEIWVAQLYPCDHCGAAMELNESTTCFGPGMIVFCCPNCGNARDFNLVKEERGRLHIASRKAEIIAVGPPPLAA